MPTQQLLSSGHVRALAPTCRPGTVPPLALLVKTADVGLLAAPQRLLQRCVTVTLAPHPALDALLRVADAIREPGGTYVLPASAAKAPSPALIAALTAAHPANWRTAGRTTVAGTLGPSLADLADTTTAACRRSRSTQPVDAAGRRSRSTQPIGRPPAVAHAVSAWTVRSGPPNRP